MIIIHLDKVENYLISDDSHRRSSRIRLFKKGDIISIRMITNSKR